MLGIARLNLILMLAACAAALFWFQEALRDRPKAGHLMATPASATAVLFHYDTPPPWPRGNCLSVRPVTRKLGVPEDSSELRVLNMHAENFQHICQQLGIARVEVKRVGEQHCLIVDERIPKAWFLKEPCRICTPSSVIAELRTSQAASFFRKSQAE